jgi:hypothetical protein
MVSRTNENVVYDVEMPWHIFGTKLAEPPTAERAIDAAGLNWKVAKKEHSDEERSVPQQSYVLVREALGDENAGRILGEVRPNSVPLQNAEAFSFLDPLVKTGGVFYESAGAISDGKWIWMVLRLRGDLEIAPNDRIGRFLVVGHSPVTAYHRVGFVPVRLVSKGVMSEGFGHNPQPLVTPAVLGPRRFEIGTEAAWVEIQGHFEELANIFKSMLQVQMSGELLREYLKTVLDAKAIGNQPPPEPTIDYELDSRECSRLFSEGKGNRLPGVRGTLWAAYGAIIEVVDHKLNVKDSRYLTNLWFNDLKARAFRMATKLIQ